MIFALIVVTIFVCCSVVVVVLTLFNDVPLTFSVDDSGAEFNSGFSLVACVILLTPVHDPYRQPRLIDELYRRDP